jgi:D-arabinose 5-phosphate isomerase GutQ
MKENIISIAKKALAIESEALVELNKYIDASFEKVVTAILNSKGRVVISGIGKSAIIAQKMVATFNSTGTPALYLHAAEAIHGDSGMIQRDDIVLIISKSGESPEIKNLVQLRPILNHHFLFHTSLLQMNIQILNRLAQISKNLLIGMTWTQLSATPGFATIPFLT